MSCVTLIYYFEELHVIQMVMLPYFIILRNSILLDHFDKSRYLYFLLLGASCDLILVYDIVLKISVLDSGNSV